MNMKYTLVWIFKKFIIRVLAKFWQEWTHVFILAKIKTEQKLNTKIWCKRRILHSFAQNQ